MNKRFISALMLTSCSFVGAGFEHATAHKEHHHNKQNHNEHHHKDHSHQHYHERIAALEAQLAELKKMVTQQQAETIAVKQSVIKSTAANNAALVAASTPGATQPAVITAGKLPNSYLLPSGLSFKFGGNINFFMLQNTGQAGAGGGYMFNNPNQIQTSVDAKRRKHQSLLASCLSRFHFKLNKAIDFGNLPGEAEPYMEIDFFGPNAGAETVLNNYGLLLRHAYVTLRAFEKPYEFVVGQTTTTFAVPSNHVVGGVDFGGQAGTGTFTRQPMIKWLYKFNDSGSTFEFSIENSENDYTSTSPATEGSAAGTPRKVVTESSLGRDIAAKGIGLDRMPDAAFRLVLNSGNFGLSLRGVARELRLSGAREGVRINKKLFAYGLGVSTHLSYKYGKLILGFMGGDGIGRYINDFAGYSAYLNPEKNNEYKTIRAMSGYISYDHYLTPKLTFSYITGLALLQLPDFLKAAPYANSVFNRTRSHHVSLIYKIGELTLGAGFTMGGIKRPNGIKGIMNRAMLQVKYDF